MAGLALGTWLLGIWPPLGVLGKLSNHLASLAEGKTGRDLVAGVACLTERDLVVGAACLAERDWGEELRSGGGWPGCKEDWADLVAEEADLSGRSAL